MIIKQRSKIHGKSDIVINVGGDFTMNDSQLISDGGDIFINVAGTFTLIDNIFICANDRNIYIKCNKFVDKTGGGAIIQTHDISYKEMNVRKFDFNSVEGKIEKCSMQESRSIFGNLWMYCSSGFNAVTLQISAGNIHIECQDQIKLGEFCGFLAVRNNIMIKSNKIAVEENSFKRLICRRHLTLSCNNLQLLKNNKLVN